MNKIWLMLPLTIAFGTAMAQSGAQLSKEQIAKQLHGVDAGDISKSPLKGLYQVTVGPNVAYVSADGRYLLVQPDTEFAFLYPDLKMVYEKLVLD